MDGQTTHFAFRLNPGDDLRSGIEDQVKVHKILAGWIATGVGSLCRYSIRLANQQGETRGEGHFEIVSLVGTVGEGGPHIHISISDNTGHTIGGHLLKGCIVNTTAEIVLVSSGKYQFLRELDEATSWKELKIKELKIN